jgi:hypothetical protein
MRKKIICLFLYILSSSFVVADEDIVFSTVKPIDMTTALSELKNIVMKKNGSFSGNEYEGSFNVPGVAGRYISDQNNLIFTITVSGINSLEEEKLWLDITLFSFSFQKPQDIFKAVETLRSSIEGKKGFFYGNENTGHFKISGITGKYLVGDIVEVFIFEKPFFISKSVIENEVKKYFDGK